MNVYSKSLREHEDAQDADRIHGAVFQIDVFLDTVDIADGQFSKYDRTQAVTDDDERD